MHYLENDYYVPARVIDRINKVTSSLMENGFYKSQKSIIDFKLKLKLRMLEVQNPKHTIDDDDDDEDEFQSLTSAHIKISFYFLLFMYGIAVLVFFGEILYFKWRNRHLGKYHKEQKIIPRLIFRTVIICIFRKSHFTTENLRCECEA